MMKVSVENYRDDTIPADNLKIGQVGVIDANSNAYYPPYVILDLIVDTLQQRKNK